MGFVFPQALPFPLSAPDSPNIIVPLCLTCSKTYKKLHDDTWINHFLAPIPQRHLQCIKAWYDWWAQFPPCFLSHPPSVSSSFPPYVPRGIKTPPTHPDVDVFFPIIAVFFLSSLSSSRLFHLIFFPTWNADACLYGKPLEKTPLNACMPIVAIALALADFAWKGEGPRNVHVENNSLLILEIVDSIADPSKIHHSNPRILVPRPSLNQPLGTTDDPSRPQL